MLTRLLSIAAVVVGLASAGVHAADGTCRALAMSGGGDKAAYEAGVVKGLFDSLPIGESQYDVVTGISAGSTLTAAFSVFPFGEEKGVIDFIYGIIDDLNQTSIFQQWPGGIVDGFLHHSSLFDSTPLRNLFEGLLSNRTLATDRVVCMGASNLRTGLFERFCDHATTMDAIDATIASAAIPGVFLDQTINGETYVDGGVTVNVDVTGAVEACLNLGYAQPDIIVDVIECGAVNMSTLSGDPSTLTVLPVLLRASTMRSFGSSQRDYEAAVNAYPQVNFRYRIAPSQGISGTGIDFNHTQMLWMESLGESDAAAAVNGGRVFAGMAQIKMD